jgi:hypothetical protein
MDIFMFIARIINQFEEENDGRERVRKLFIIKKCGLGIIPDPFFIDPHLHPAL